MVLLTGQEYWSRFIGKRGPQVSLAAVSGAALRVATSVAIVSFNIFSFFSWKTICQRKRGHFPGTLHVAKKTVNSPENEPISHYLLPTFL